MDRPEAVDRPEEAVEETEVDEFAWEATRLWNEAHGVVALTDEARRRIEREFGID